MVLGVEGPLRIFISIKWRPGEEEGVLLVLLVLLVLPEELSTLAS